MMMRRGRAIAPAVSVALCLVTTLPAIAEGRTTVTAGWIELATVGESGLQLNAKLDTGADLSSIDARDIVRFAKGRERWARFTLVPSAGTAQTLEAPIVRQARIRRAGAPTETRVVVRLRVCVAGKAADTDVTLSDRSSLDVPMLIGRAFLAGRIVVDSAARDLLPAACPSATSP